MHMLRPAAAHPPSFIGRASQCCLPMPWLVRGRAELDGPDAPGLLQEAWAVARWLLAAVSAEPERYPRLAARLATLAAGAGGAGGAARELVAGQGALALNAHSMTEAVTLDSPAEHGVFVREPRQELFLFLFCCSAVLVCWCFGSSSSDRGPLDSGPRARQAGASKLTHACTGANTIYHFVPQGAGETEPCSF